MNNATNIAPGGARLDDWTCISLVPTAVPNQSRLGGSVFRGMQDLEAAKEYANEVHEFWQAHGIEAPVFVVRGPTSTAPTRFEVVAAPCGYTVLYQKGVSRPAQTQTFEAPEAVCVDHPRMRG